MRSYLILFVICCLLTRCGDSRQALHVDRFEGASANAAGFLRLRQVASDQQQAPLSIERKLIRNGSISFEVADVEAARRSVADLTKAFGGYISSDNQNDYSGSPQYQQTIRVPADKLDEFISKIEELARHVDSKSVSIEDVTEQFIDVEARLKTKKELEARYLELLKQAKAVKDIVEIETQLGNVRAEIESMEGRLKYLTDQVTFSTLTVTYYQTVSATYGFGHRFLSSFGEGWDAFLGFLIGVFTAWPFLILIAVIAWAIRRWWRARKLKAS